MRADIHNTKRLYILTKFLFVLILMFSQLIQLKADTDPKTQGDAYLNESKFSMAIESYKKSISLLYRADTSEEIITQKENVLNGKIKEAFKAGSLWLSNKINQYCDQAEESINNNQKDKAITVLEKAAWLLNSNRDFSNRKIENRLAKLSEQAGFDNEDINDKFSYYYMNQNNHFGLFSIGFGSISAVSWGIGYYFDMRVTDTNSEYDTLLNKYHSSTDFNEATSLHDQIKDKMNKSKKYATARNAAYGAGIILTAITGYYLYNFLKFNMIDTEMENNKTDVSFYFVPVSSGFIADSRLMDNGYANNSYERGMSVGISCKF